MYGALFKWLVVEAWTNLQNEKNAKERECVCCIFLTGGNLTFLFVATDFLMGTDIEKILCWVMLAFVCSTGHIKYRKNTKKKV